jgi:actin-like ATPase involved in cell morphogenesis
VALLDYAAALRRQIAGRRTGRPWGVIASPAGAAAGQVAELRAIAGQIFERFLVVDESALAAMAVLHAPAGRHAVVVDLGAVGVRASLVSGAAPEPGQHTSVPQGGDAVDAALHRLLLQRYPDLALTDCTLTRLKEELSFVAPAARKVRLRLVLGGTARLVDITEILREACEILALSALKATREVLARCPSDSMEQFLSSIILVGGGSAMPGLPRRIQEELRRDGLDAATVHTVGDPRSLMALGALKWALATPDEAWGTPLFAWHPAA